MDFERAMTGAWSGLGIGLKEPPSIRDKKWAIVYALEYIFVRNKASTRDCHYVHFRINDLEPTFLNTWDYQWPTDFEYEVKLWQN